jgi:hypothetical protein
MSTVPDKYEKASIERQKHVDGILASPAKKKIVVAGPGTGKTHLFKKILEGKSNTLTLSFINALIEDLSLELCGLSDVKTLHGFARSALASSGKSVKVFPKLSTVIKEDAKILLKSDINFDRLFHTRDDENEHIKFYKKRKDYYDHYGYADIVFAIVKIFEIKKERIPTYEQVVVDEFQDFNKLEVSLIELLAEKSPILLAGDDDQALYDFKDASPEHIRLKHGNKDSGYAPFSLPYCSRCTRVIVEAANDVIATAMKIGYLKGRLKKPYQYFEDKKKDRESELNPKIVCGQLFAIMIPWFIETQLAEIAKEMRGSFSVLIISPTKVQSRDIVTALEKKGLVGIKSVEKRGGSEPTLLDGLKILLETGDSNLGWRIASKFFLKSEDFESLVTQSNADEAKAVAEIIGGEEKRAITSAVKILKAVRDDKDVDEKKLDGLLAMLSIKPQELAKNVLRDETISTAQRIGNPSIRKIPIKATTIQSSKGLDAEYVFITHFDDRYFIKNKDKKNISDQDICNFLVALTRAKKKVFLISTGKTEPTFLKWIDKSRIEIIEFNFKNAE